MPLRARVGGREVYVWDLPGAEWAELRRRCRAGEPAAVRMACCGAPGLAKTSRRGNPFFAHRTRSRPVGAACRWAGEGAAHALCKLLAAAGARAAGWGVRTEAVALDGGWRADVLCARGAARVALEVQLARPRPGELAARQARYRAAGVRGAWVLPPDLCPPPCRGLPAFPLELADGTPRVALGGGAPGGAPGPALPLDAFVARLLGGGVRFEEQRVARPPLGCPVLVTAPDACRRCGGRFEHVAGVTNIAATAARPRYWPDGDVPVTALRDLWDADRGRAWSAVAAVRRLRRGEAGLSPLAPRRCAVVGGTYLTALCPSCGAAQGDGAVDRLLTSRHPRVPVRVPVPPAPLAFRPLDGRPPRAAMGGWRGRVTPARWRLDVEPGGAATGGLGDGPAPAVRCAAAGPRPPTPA